eukprot:213079_1
MSSDEENDEIVPPPDLQPIIQTTASYVAKKGPDFEKQIALKQANNKRFDFLKPSSPYHAWYRSKVDEVKEGKPAEKQPSTEDLEAKKAEEAARKKQEELEREQKQKDEAARIPLPQKLEAEMIEDLKPKEETVREPPTDNYTVPVPDNVIAFDIDVIKLTAQFVAKNGRQFLATLTNREQRNPQFDFLKPGHILFSYFERLVAAYRQVIAPSEQSIEYLRKCVESITFVRDELIGRAEFENRLKQKKEDAKKNADEERVAMQLIDWHDFVVLESITFEKDDDEYLPVPAMTIKEIEETLDAEKRLEQNALAAEEEQMDLASENESSESESEISDEDMEAGDTEDDEESLAEGDEEVEAVAPEDGTTEVTEVEAVPVLPVPRTKIATAAEVANVPTLETAAEMARRVEKQRQEQIATRSASDYQKCTVCGEHILVAELEEHMRIELLDPKWKEQKQAQLSKNRDSSLATPDDIAKNLASFAKERRIRREEAKDEDEKAASSSTIPPVQQKTSPQKSIPRQATTQPTFVSTFQQQPVQQVPPRMSQHPGIVPSFMPVVQPFMHPPMMRMPVQPGMMAPFIPQQQLRQAPPVTRPAMPAPPQGRPATGTAMPAPPQGHPTGAAMPAPPQGRPQSRAPPAPVGEPPLKRARVEQPTASELIPEELFMRTNPPNVNVNIQVPSDPSHSEWNFNGQVITIPMQLNNTINELKNRIQTHLGGMPSNKQKLRVAGVFAKDGFTLAYYNITQNVMIELGFRGRGGGRK